MGWRGWTAFAVVQLVGVVCVWSGPRILAVLFVFGGPCFAQQKDTTQCSTIYENHNQTDDGPLKVRAVGGINVIQVAPPLKGARMEMVRSRRSQRGRVALQGRACWAGTLRLRHRCDGGRHNPRTPRWHALLHSTRTSRS